MDTYTERQLEYDRHARAKSTIRSVEDTHEREAGFVAERRRHDAAMSAISDAEWEDSITAHPCGLRTRISQSGNLLILDGETMRFPTAAEWNALGIAPYHEWKVEPPMSRSAMRESRETTREIMEEHDVANATPFRCPICWGPDPDGTCCEDDME